MKNKFTLRIDEELLEKMEYLAEYDGRSINREIETAIKRFVRDFERLNGEIKTKECSAKENYDENPTKMVDRSLKF